MMAPFVDSPTCGRILLPLSYCLYVIYNETESCLMKYVVKRSPGATDSAHLVERREVAICTVCAASENGMNWLRWIQALKK